MNIPHFFCLNGTAFSLAMNGVTSVQMMVTHHWKLLWQPLPAVIVSGSSKAVHDHDEDRHTHPTTVLYWTDFCDNVKSRLSQPDIMVCCPNNVSCCPSHTYRIQLMQMPVLIRLFSDVHQQLSA